MLSSSFFPLTLFLFLSLFSFLSLSLFPSSDAAPSSSSPIPSTSKQPHIVIIGSGPTGLGAAFRLYELGYTSFTLIEGSNMGGGLAKSVVDENGFTWDHGVHVLFSHFKYFDTLLDWLLPPKEWYHHERNSPAYMNGRFVGYPVQQNIFQLEKNQTITALMGMIDAWRGSLMARDKAKNFHEWLLQGFGQGISDIFMIPYNEKVWAHPTQEMNTQWVGERVATLDIKKIIKNTIMGVEDISWGPNAHFRYPAHGSGQIWFELLDRLPKNNVVLNKKLVGVETVKNKDTGKKRLIFEDGTALHYDYLLSTLAIPKLLTKIVDNPTMSAMATIPGAWKFQTVHLVGIGVWGEYAPGYANQTHWIYFPEDKYIFYRLTVLSKFSPHMVAQPGKQYSIIAEVSESKYRKVPATKEEIIQKVIDGLILSKFISASDRLATKWHERFEYGYPVPYVDRDLHVHAVDKLLKAAGIWSRGRFGGWKYEVANQDHCMMQGVEAIDNILFGTEELTFYHPDLVNGGKGRQAPIRPPSPAPFEKASIKANQFYSMKEHEWHAVNQIVKKNINAADDAVAQDREVINDYGNSNNDGDNNNDNDGDALGRLLNKKHHSSNTAEKHIAGPMIGILFLVILIIGVFYFHNGRFRILSTNNNKNDANHKKESAGLGNKKRRTMEGGMGDEEMKEIKVGVNNKESEGEEGMEEEALLQGS